MKSLIQSKLFSPSLAPNIFDVTGTLNNILTFPTVRRPQAIRWSLNGLQTVSALSAKTSCRSTISGETPRESCIGIVRFLQGKNYFVTGATGFLAKAFIEKLLRTVPDVGKIFLLIKAKDQEAAIERLNKEIINSDLFGCLKQIHGEFYESFVTDKLIPVVGNIGEKDLGLDVDTGLKIAQQIDVIVSAAASTTFDERYDVALNINVQGPSRLLNFARKCNNLCLFLHFSTAYVNGESQGTIMEKPFYMGENIIVEKITQGNFPVLVPMLNIYAEKELASRVAKTSEDKGLNSRLKELGLERAKLYGWQNTYSFTKAVGEMVISKCKGDFPVVVIRPSVIESSYESPFPGWIQGNRMLDPLILGHGKGYLPAFLADPQTIVDVVPVDIVVNATMAAMAKHGLAAKPEVNVYHVTSSTVNPLHFGDIFELCYNHFVSSPMRDVNDAEIRVTRMQFYNSMEEFSSYIENALIELNGLNKEAEVSDLKARQWLKMKRKKTLEHIINMAKVYEPYTFYRGRFDSRNIQNLIEGMSSEEKMVFGFDLSSLDWEHYITKIHIPGLRRHVMKRKSTSEDSTK